MAQMEKEDKCQQGTRWFQLPAQKTIKILPTRQEEKKMTATREGLKKRERSESQHIVAFEFLNFGIFHQFLTY